MPEIPSNLYQGPVDPNAGFLCLSVYWQPNPEAPDPQKPGNKLSVSLFLPVDPDDICLCESGKIYRACCRQQHYWHPICIDPDDEHFSLYSPRMATFRGIDPALIREKLRSDPRLHHTIEAADNDFWIYWGDPPIESQYGILCFGDLETKGDKLVMTALSEARFHVLLSLLHGHFGESLPKPRVKTDPVMVLDKRTGKPIHLPPRAARLRQK